MTLSDVFGMGWLVLVGVVPIAFIIYSLVRYRRRPVNPPPMDPYSAVPPGWGGM